MRWLAATLVLVAASAALVTGIYLRDRGSGDWMPPQRTLAYHDAMAVAAHIGGTCPRDCVVELLGHPRQDHWTERIEIPRATMCLDINVRSFATSLVNGISGVSTVGCAATPSPGSD